MQLQLYVGTYLLVPWYLSLWYVGSLVHWFSHGRLTPMAYPMRVGLTFWGQLQVGSSEVVAWPGEIDFGQGGERRRVRT